MGIMRLIQLTTVKQINEDELPPSIFYTDTCFLKLNPL